MIQSDFSNVKAVIFDLDGTLIDTERLYSVIWPRTIADMGYEMTHEQYLSLRSLGRPFAPLRFKDWYGDDFDYDLARKIRSGYFNSYIDEHGIDVKKGAVELLQYLHSKNIITAIATATDIERATRFLKMTGLDCYFDHIISATMVKEGKPSPYIYQYACEQLNLDSSVCIAVEDAPNGIKAAYGANLRVIMVPDMTGPDEEINSMISACVDSLDEICELI